MPDVPRGPHGVADQIPCGSKITVKLGAALRIVHIGTVVTPSDRMDLLHISSAYLHASTVLLDLRIVGHYRYITPISSFDVTL